MVRPLVNQNFCLGHPVIDTEHAAIGEYWQEAVSCERLQLPLHLARLKRAMARHFDHEAEILAKTTGMSLCTRHRAEHSALLELCSEAALLYERDWRKAQSLLRNRFATMVREHIISMDLCAVLLIQTAGTGAPCDPMTVG
ncbi:MAG: hypothetical protein K8H87_15670 [Pseudorhodoplanes sp.]|nr:hypothetical protein [Pseudorhodoplanes sp.]